MPDESRPRSLSEREVDCLRLASDGLSSPKIARVLGLSPRTVDEYLSSACLKLGVRTRIQAVGKAIRLGVL
jgi:LuxR family transcriptional regulator of spore coat protein